MKHLHLSPFEQLEGDLIEFEFTTFKGGEPQIRIKPFDVRFFPVKISIRVSEFNDIGKLLVAVDALRRMGVNDISLFIPYFPAARQDRIMTPGESLTSKVYADIINSMEFSRVTIFDPHSDVVTALIDNCEVIDNHDFVKDCMRTLYENDSNCGNANSHIISPDAGANKKSLALVQSFGHESLIKCDKTRDVITGKLTGFKVYAEDLQGKDCIVVDDICDGGGTFIGLAAELKKKNAGNLYLIVSHGVFSKGMKGINELKKHYKYIFTTDSVDVGRYCILLTGTVSDHIKILPCS